MAFILENHFSQNNILLGSFHFIFLLGAEVWFYLIFFFKSQQNIQIQPISQALK